MEDSKAKKRSGTSLSIGAKTSHESLNELRRKIVLAAHQANEGHIPSAFSILNLVYCVYFDATKKYNFDFKEKDTFILSKGHGSLALYSVLSSAGYFSENWINEFAKFESPFGGHPDRNKVNGVTASTGSLGHGLSIGVGIALANKINGKEHEVIILIGDGELNEGSIWESLLLASGHNLGKITVIVDDNKSSERALNLGNLEDKFKSFGFITNTIDGHSHDQIVDSLIPNNQNKPKAIIANTIKGFGVSLMENNAAWHHATPTKIELDEILSELK